MKISINRRLGYSCVCSILYRR